jgi:hypothetical protein
MAEMLAMHGAIASGLLRIRRTSKKESRGMTEFECTPVTNRRACLLEMAPRCGPSYRTETLAIVCFVNGRPTSAPLIDHRSGVVIEWHTGTKLRSARQLPP